MLNRFHPHGEHISLTSAEELRDAQHRLHDRISVNAYHRFGARGRTHGHDVEDWLLAEAEIVAKPLVVIHEHDGCLHVEVVLPAAVPRLLHVGLTPESLIVHAPHAHEHPADESGPHACELCDRVVYREVHLPKRVVVEGVRAELRKGVISLTARLADTAGPTVWPQAGPDHHFHRPHDRPESLW